MLKRRQAADIAAEIAAAIRLHRLSPSAAGRHRRLSIYYQCDEIRSLSPDMHGEIYSQALANLRGTHAYNQLLVAALISVAAVCLLPPRDFASTLALAAITLATCTATLLFCVVYLRRAMKLIAAELAKLGC